MFVSEAPSPRFFSISDEALKTLPETIALLELRLSVEVEAAGLCAERRTDDEVQNIRSLMEQTDARHDDPAAVQIHCDYDFHLAIAKATQNDLMYGFLSYLRPMIVPRFQLGYIVSRELKEAYYARIHAEHDTIVRAIERKIGAEARKAMREHLANSLERVRALGFGSGVDNSDPVQKLAFESLFGRLTQSLGER
jgi:DNA-binding FadR family transcriptional regulator